MDKKASEAEAEADKPCPKNGGQKHAFTMYTKTGVPQCENCGALADSY